MAVELGTVRIKHIKRWWQAGYFRMDEQAAAVTTLAPVADSLHFYAKDNGGVSGLYWRDDANIEHEVAGAAAIITDHTALTSLAWELSGHTGTADKLAAFDGSGNPTFADPSTVTQSEPLTNGDPLTPELIFDSFGDVIMA